MSNQYFTKDLWITSQESRRLRDGREIGRTPRLQDIWMQQSLVCFLGYISKSLRISKIVTVFLSLRHYYKDHEFLIQRVHGKRDTIMIASAIKELTLGSCYTSWSFGFIARLLLFWMHRKRIRFLKRP